MQLIQRKEYTDFLIRHKDKQIIKVISGVRRSGKSTLFSLFRKHLTECGISDEQMIEINFEDIRFENIKDYTDLYDHISKCLLPDKMNYIFLDEIQHVSNFEKAVDSLFLKENCDIYITGSNAYFMSGELATNLTGRYVELQILPLSFKEFCESRKNSGKNRDELFELYLAMGSFPYVTRYECDIRDSQEYMTDLYRSILLKDVVNRLKISDVTTLENVSKFLFHNIGNPVSASKIAAFLTSSGKKTDIKTIQKYTRGLEDSLLFYGIRAWNIKGKEFLTGSSKMYAVDIGLRNLMVKGSGNEIGHILENIVFLELKRRSQNVFTGKIDSNEVDFVTADAENIVYYQVAATTLDENTLERELKPLQKIKDNHPKILLTLDTSFRTMNYDGILKINVLDWLLEEK